jgi:hypothetical protein
MPSASIDNAGISQSRIWTFAKGGDELTVEQWVEGERVVVTLTRSNETGAETTQGCDFPNERAAEHFHANLDASLLQFGWVFVGHLPNRRGHRDRRHLVRKSDRRRWWTDGWTFLE